MWDRLLCAIDQFESGQAAVGFATGLAEAYGTEVRVFHVRELSKWARVVPLESPAEADLLVDEAVFSLRFAGVGAQGRALSALEDHVAERIVEESLFWGCDAVVIGSRRLRGLGRLSGRGVRERLLRASALPVLVAPAPVTNGVHSPRRFHVVS
jgi:nucleotide-binding universal stress UspA family protein